MKKIILAALLLTAALHAQVTKIGYESNDEVVKNPERGFYMELYSSEAGGYQSLATQFADPERGLQALFDDNNMTLIRFVVQLDSFIGQPHISPDFIHAINADFHYLREHHLKCVLRYCYTLGDPIGGAYEPSVDVILAHIQDLHGVTRGNQDVISSMEAGFIGNYGEWYSAGNDFGIGEPGVPQLNIPGLMNATQLENRRQVGMAVLGMTDDRMVAFRTPFFQRLIAPPGSQDKLYPKYNGKVGSRVAAHDDAFLHQRNDEGTFIIVSEDADNPVAGDTGYDRDYLHTKSQYTLTGGESNTPKSGEDLPNDPAESYWSCSTANNFMNMDAVDQLSAFHYNYLNYEFFGDIINQWHDEGCYNDIHEHLGYRFVLQDASLDHGSKRLLIHLMNEGYGHVINKRPVYLVLQNEAGLRYRVNIEGPTDSEGGNGLAPDVPTEVRAWYPRNPASESPIAGRISLHKTLEGLHTATDGDIPPDNYHLYLELPDGDSIDDGDEVTDLLQNDPGYSIRMANTDHYTLDGVDTTSSPFWVADTGLNNLFFDVTIDKSGNMGKASGTSSKMAVGALVFDATVSPNPSDAGFRLHINAPTEGQVTIKVFDMVGKLLESRTASSSGLSDLEVGSSLAAGIYSVVIKQGDNEKKLRIMKK